MKFLQNIIDLMKHNKNCNGCRAFFNSQFLEIVPANEAPEKDQPHSNGLSNSLIHNLKNKNQATYRFWDLNSPHHA